MHNLFIFIDNNNVILLFWKFKGSTKAVNNGEKKLSAERKKCDIEFLNQFLTNI